MTLELITPTLGQTKKNVKDLIISTLMYEYPLTLIKLTNAIKKKYSAKVTFQGVRWAVNSLVEDGVLLKNKKEYEINNKWILKMKDFFDKLNDSYTTQQGNILNIEELGDEIKIYTMKNMIEADRLWNNIIAKWFKEDKDNTKEKIYAQLAGHTWYVFGQMGEEANIVELAQKNKIKSHVLCNSNTFLDKWCKKYYTDLGIKFTTNKDKSKGNNSKYFGVYKEYIIQIEQPEWLVKEIDKTYLNATTFEKFDALRLTRALLKESEIKVMVIKNNLLAEQLRKNVLKHF